MSPNNVELNLISSLGPENVEHDEQDNEQESYNNESNLNLAHSNDEINSLQSSHQHRKTVELIAHHQNGEGVQCEDKPVASFLGSNNTKNRRRKKLRKT